MKKNIFIILSLACLSVFTACDKKSEVAEPAKDVENLQYSLDKRTVTLTWQLPTDEKVIAIQVVENSSKQFVEIEGTATKYVVERAQRGVELEYIVRTITDKSISIGKSVNLYIPPTPPAMLLLASDIEALPDDDERAAAELFKANYVDKGNGAFVSAADLATLSVEDYSMLFVIVDRVGIGHGYQNLPADLVSDAARMGLMNYLKEGGCIFFAKHATQMVCAIGRIEDTYMPGLFGDGDGGVGDDTWCVNANIGVGQATNYDHRGHYIFQNMQTESEFYGHETMPLLGPGGHREDHNCMWDCNAYGFPGDPNVIKNFEDATTSTVLATWGHVTDYCCAGIIEFRPTSEIRGTIIANGLSAYEFHQNNQDNQYQGNIDLLTTNTIDYLFKLGQQ